MMEDYAGVEILRREGKKVWFRLTCTDGTSWVSWRVTHAEGRFSLAERHDPRSPFEFMQHVWTYRELGPESTEMCWEMNFELPDVKRNAEPQAAAYLVARTDKNQAKMKSYIEEQYRAARRPLHTEGQAPTAGEPFERIGPRGP